MLGLGEERSEVLALMDDLRSANVDFLTIGQYLRPTPRHAPVVRYAEPSEFEDYARAARERGFLLVSSSPLTRSSYHAAEDFERLRAARLEREGPRAGRRNLGGAQRPEAGGESDYLPLTRK